MLLKSVGRVSESLLFGEFAELLNRSILFCLTRYDKVRDPVWGEKMGFRG